MSSTIAAISTATGSAGIGIIRMSGKDCFDILKKIFVPKNNNNNIKGYTIKYGNIVDNGRIVDEVLVSYFVNPKSYTKENMCEINSHGGSIVEKEILELCLKKWCRTCKTRRIYRESFLKWKD